MRQRIGVASSDNSASRCTNRTVRLLSFSFLIVRLYVRNRPHYAISSGRTGSRRHDSGPGRDIGQEPDVAFDRALTWPLAGTGIRRQRIGPVLSWAYPGRKDGPRSSLQEDLLRVRDGPAMTSGTGTTLGHGIAPGPTRRPI